MTCLSDADLTILCRVLRIDRDDPNVLKSAEKGYSMAQKIRCRLGSVTPRELAEIYGIAILLITQEHGLVGGTAILSSYESVPPKIRLYQDSLKRAQSLIEEFGFSSIFREIDDVCIAHEIYHHLECREHKSPIIREVAAHCFTKAFLDLPVIPALVNLFFQGTGITSSGRVIRILEQKILAKAGQIC